MDDYNLIGNHIYNNNMNIFGFSKMLDSTMQCYKFYWLEAILSLIVFRDDDISFDEIVNEMICQAWHLVTGYCLYLGPTIQGKKINFLEQAVQILAEDSEIGRPTTKIDLLNAIVRNDDKLKFTKEKLVIYVPYRMLSSFLGTLPEEKMWDQRGKLISYIQEFNKTTELPYIIIDGRGLNRKIRFSNNWKRVILDNYSKILGWVQFKKICYIQNYYPNIPGLIYKLYGEEDFNIKI